MEGHYTFSFLKEHDIPDLYNTFQEAFADYIVPIKLSLEQFYTKLKREGVELTFCAGAYHEQKLVGFIMTGLGEWQGKPTAYNAGTGVVPEHRGRKLTQELYAFMLPKLRESGIEQCLLEVIQENEAALKSYQKIGFRITRTFDCFRALKQDLILPEEKPLLISLQEAAKPNWQAYRQFYDIRPSWQHTEQAYKRSPDQKKVLEAYDEDKLLVGFVAFFPRTGAISQLGVSATYRGQGVATALLQEALQQTEVPALLVINVDTSCHTCLEYLKRRHFTRILGQYEMLLPLE